MIRSYGQIAPVKALLTVLAASLIVGLANCGKPVPVKELTEARAEIQAAENVDAAQYAADNLKGAKEALILSHQLLVDEKLDPTKNKAIEARDLALKARETSSPLFGAKIKEKSEAALKDADEAYSEKLAPDDFQAAKKLFEEGKTELKAADDGNKGQGKAEDRQNHLRKYSVAYKKLEAAFEAARRAKNVALAQKGDLLDSLAGVQTMLRTAETYGAKESVPDLYKQAQSEIDTARTEIESGKLKKGNQHIIKSEELARAVLKNSLEQYARKKKEEATVAVGKADESHGKTNPDDIKNDELKQKLSRIKESLEAAKEALGSAGTNYDSQKYEPSIKDSDEAIRLSKIVDEQMKRFEKALALVVKKRGGKVVPDKKEPTTTTGKEGEWKRYVVRRRKPADCLWRIAARKKFYGNGFLWKKIYRANRKKIRNPNLIYPGQVLVIPPKNSKSSKPPEKVVVEEKVEKVEKKVEKKVKDKDDDTQPRENIE